MDLPNDGETEKARPISDFLRENQQLFTIVGIFGAFIIYLTTMFKENPTIELVFGIYSAFAMMIYVSFLILSECIFKFNSKSNKIIELCVVKIMCTPLRINRTKYLANNS